MERNLSCLKASHFILPVLSLALVGAWNATQVRTIRTLERAGTEVRGRIATVQAGGGQESVAMAGVGKAARPGTGRKYMDWKELAAKFLEMENGGTSTDIRSRLTFQQDLMNMTLEEMIAALDEIEGLDISDEARELLEAAILESLIRKDPEYALKRFADRIEGDSNELTWQLSSAFGQWAKKDLAAASKWFDEQIRNGKFESKSLDGKSDSLVEFESELMGSLLSSDANTAGDRLAALPEDQRREVLEKLSFADLSPEEQKAYAGLIREFIPADERQGSFAHIASQLVDDSGYGKVSAFLDSVQATAAEREAAAKQTADSQLESLAERGKVTKEAVDSLRDWLARQSPGNVDALTGKALAEAAQDGGNFDYAEASQLVLKYQRSTGNDDVLVAFLEGYSAHSNLEQALHLAEMISDEKRRAEVLKHLK